jgi:hypothetical protein
MGVVIMAWHVSPMAGHSSIQPLHHVPYHLSILEAFCVTQYYERHPSWTISRIAKNHNSHEAQIHLYSFTSDEPFAIKTGFKGSNAADYHDATQPLIAKQ